MKNIIGIDVGGSTTKIVGFQDGRLLTPLMVRASDPEASVYGAFGKFTSENGISLDTIERVMLTGVGSSFINEDIYGLDTYHVNEFEAIGNGGIFLSEFDKAVVVSMGTGTAFVYADESGNRHLGGTGVGGGTIIGLSKRMISMQNVELIAKLAEDGDISKIDLLVDDITKHELGPTLSSSLTAANFGKVSELAEKTDLALGIINMVFETIAMMSVFAARERRCAHVVLTGNLTVLPQCSPMFEKLETLLGMRFVIPENASFATAIGASLIDHTKINEC